MERDSGLRFRSSYSSVASTASKTVPSPGLNTTSVSATQILVTPVDPVAKMFSEINRLLADNVSDQFITESFDQENFSKLYDMLEDHPRRAALRICYANNEIDITMLPSGAHEAAHKTLAEFIKNFVANAHHGGLPGVQGLVHLGAKTHVNAITGATIEGDSVLAPTVSPDFPTLVIECGHSQTHSRLLIKMDKWLNNFASVLAVIIINIDHDRAGTVDIEMWQRDVNSAIGRTLFSTTTFNRSNAPANPWSIPWGFLYPGPQPPWAVGPTLIIPAASMNQYHIELYSVFM
ncbi:hypothetical protein DFH09DRAFT_364210 [Mycena vulgaris]|nr:hypothetical protein DFH09DRAFT_364210 [Mycena vulgaris]